MKPITKAILPVAGFGTRFLPATKAQPKEMLPVYDKPAIQYIVEEAVAAGITDIIIVTGRGKRAIEDHFDVNFELEQTLQEKGKTSELAAISKLSSMANFVYVRQPQPLGDGHALLCAQSLVGEDESVVVLFGDDIVDSGPHPNAVQQLLQTYETTQEPVVLLEQVTQDKVDQYGIAKMNLYNDREGTISQLVEKPNPKQAPSNLGVIGKYIITPAIWQALANIKPGSDGEIRLASAFADYLASGANLHGRVLQGQRFDTGDKLSFLEATLHFARSKNPEGVAELMKKL